MLHAIIIDDELNGLVSLDLMIKKYTPEIKVVAKTIDPQDAIELINNYRPDIIFLDINMPNLNGFELLEKIEFRNFQLIFTTAHEEFALKAIKQNALDYLLKPIAADDLKLAVQKITKNLNKEDIIKSTLQILKSLKEPIDIKVNIPAKDGVQLVSSSEIMYIEADSNQAIVVLNNKAKINVSKSLKDYEKQLCMENSKFIRLHNSFIVNVDYVTRYVPEDGGYAVVQNERSIPISKNKKEEFLELINFKTR